jgi:hypothetical protein
MWKIIKFFNNLVDLFTKLLATTRHKQIVKKIGMYTLSFIFDMSCPFFFSIHEGIISIMRII